MSFLLIEIGLALFKVLMVNQIIKKLKTLREYYTLYVYV